jgi:hypothetical protein
VKLDAADIQDFKPLIRSVVATVLDELRAHEDGLSGQLGFTEPEAAAIIGVARHVLRDCRLRGEIVAKRVGKRIIYARSELLRFLNERE